MTLQEKLAEIEQSIRDVVNWIEVPDRRLNERGAKGYTGYTSPNGWTILLVIWSDSSNGIDNVDGTATRGTEIVRLTPELAAKAAAIVNERQKRKEKA